MAKAKKSKQELLRAYLIKYKSITSWEAIQKLKATRLAAMIFNLEKSGWKFSRKSIKSDGTSYTRYTLASIPKNYSQL
jgi:hypothetical protein